MLVFVDDILIYSKTEEEHEDHLRTVLQTHKEHQLYAKFSKCEFWLTEVKFLGNVVSALSVSVDPEKVETVMSWERLKSVFEILERVGTVAYRLALPPSLSGVHEVLHVSMLEKYTLDLTYVVDWGELIIDTDETFEEGPVHIMDSREQVLRCKTVKLVKVL